jgi:hypothetical protein
MADETSNIDYSGIDDVGTEYSAMNDPSTVPVTTSAPTTGVPEGSLTDIASAIMGTGTAKGAALGALFTELLKQQKSGEGVVRPMDMSQYAIPGRDTTVAAPRFVPYSEYGARDVPAMSDEMMRSFGAPTGLGSMMQPSQYSAMPTMASRAPMTFSSVGTGRNTMPSLSLTPRSNEPISPLTGALLGGALGYLVTPESAASARGAKAAGQLYDIAGGAVGNIGGALVDFFKRPATTGGNVGPNVPTGSGGEAYYEQGGKTYAINPDGSTRLVYDPTTGEGSAGGYDPDQFGGYEPSYTLPSNYYVDPYDSRPYGDVNFGSGMTYTSPYTYTPTLSGGSQTGSYYSPTSDAYYGDYSDYGSFGFKDGGMAVPLMADGGMAEPSFYTYGTVVDPMQMMTSSQGMAQGGMAQGGLHVPTVEGRHDYRAGSRVMGEGDGQSDDIPAMLADGEYVFDADTVAQLGNGSSKAGSDMLDKFREEIRAHKRSAPVNKIPPASKSPLQYLKQAQSRSKKNG